MSLNIPSQPKASPEVPRAPTQERPAAASEEIRAQEQAYRTQVADLQERETNVRAADQGKIKEIRQGLGLEADPKDLLLSPEETARMEQKENGMKTINKRSGEQEITVLGTEHAGTEEKVQEMKAVLDASNPDLVLTEGESLEARFPGKTIQEILDMEPKDVLAQQEQAYATWLAKKQGREVRSWDLPAGGEVRATLDMQDKDGQAKHSSAEATEWIATFALKKLYENPDAVPSAQALFNIVLQGIPGAAKILEVTPEKLAVALQEATGRSLEDFERQSHDPEQRAANRALVEKISDPGTNPFARDMNAARDRHAINVMEQAKRDGYKNVLVTAGRSHTITWEPALDALYKNTP